jgi:hypothetical protein
MARDLCLRVGRGVRGSRGLGLGGVVCGLAGPDLKIVLLVHLSLPRFIIPHTCIYLYSFIAIQ